MLFFDEIIYSIKCPLYFCCNASKNKSMIYKEKKNKTNKLTIAVTFQSKQTITIIITSLFTPRTNPAFTIVLNIRMALMARLKVTAQLSKLWPHSSVGKNTATIKQRS